MSNEPPAVSLQIDAKTIHELVSGQLRAAVAMTFAQHSPTIINAMVDSVLKRKVDNSGNESRYSDGQPLIQYLMGKVVQEAVEAEIRAHVAANATKVREQIAAHLKRKPDVIAGQLAAAMLESLGSQWSFQIKAEVVAASHEREAKR